MTRQIFVPAVGQYDNIGDIILRRPLLDILRAHGRLHVYLGRYPQGYRDALALSDTDIVYQSFGQWYLALLRLGTDYSFKPGEIQLSAVGMKEHIAMLPAAVLVRLRRGQVARIGAGARSINRFWAALVRPSVALSTVVYWRDEDTARALSGGIMPDLGFATGSPDVEHSHREWLTVSMRGDRPVPTREWVEAVRELALRNRLELVVVTQVARDDERTRELSRLLNATTIPWTGDDHGPQEQRLRSQYRATRIVVSDRLHVLITAATEGATPLALLPAPTTKIDRHFEAAGIARPSVVTAQMSVSAILDSAERVLADAAGIAGQVAEARNRVHLVADELGDRMTRS